MTGAGVKIGVISDMGKHGKLVRAAKDAQEQLKRFLMRCHWNGLD
jgi:hypothetical protein